MTELIVGRKGQCRCGQVQFLVSAAPLITMACHCSGCQRMSASAYSLSALYLSDQFKVTLGDPVIGGLHGATRHFFCAFCMSWLFTRPEGLDQVVNVRATMLEGAREFLPFLETCTEEMLPWAKTPAVRSFPKFPPRELFPQLIAEFGGSSVFT
jgi:hypothetical protein